MAWKTRQNEVTGPLVGTLAALILFWGTLGLGMAQLLEAESRALLIGIGRYPTDPLPGIGHDLRLMADAMRILGFTGPGQIEVLAEEAATVAGIRAAIRRVLIEGVTANDRVVLYFTGHGDQVVDSNQDENDGIDEVLLPYDFAMLWSNDGGPAFVNVLVDDEVDTLLMQSPAGEIIVLVDACHSGTVTKSVSPYAKLESLMPVDGSKSLRIRAGSTEPRIALLSAAQADQEARTVAGGSLFTEAVAAAIRDAAARRYLTLNELRLVTSAFIRQRLADRPYVPHEPDLSGASKLWNLNLFLTGIRLPAGDPWPAFERLVRDAGEALPLASPRISYRDGDQISLTVTARRSGYLYAFSLADGEGEVFLLFPSSAASGWVGAGTRIEISSVGGPGYHLTAELPAGLDYQGHLVVVIQTSERLALPALAAADYGRDPMPARQVVEQLRRSLAGSRYQAEQIVLNVRRGGR